MSQEPMKLDEMITRLQAGDIAPGSREGIDAIRQIAMASPQDVSTKLYHVPNDILEKGMRSAGMSEDDIEDLLKLGDDSRTPENPFAGATELTPSPELDRRLAVSPLEYDPAAEMRNGPRRR